MTPALAWITLLAPLAGMLLLVASGGREPSRGFTRLVGVGSVAVSFACALALFLQMLGKDDHERALVSTAWRWADLEGLRIDLSLLVDPLSMMMMLVITGVGSLIVLYSTEYMGHDRDYRRFFAEMDFFIFAMLLLVMAANFVFLIVGWAFVGLASYLLIGYYYEKPAAVAAAKKAFVINVLGDVGLVLAAVMIAREVGALDFATVFASAPDALGAGSTVAEFVAVMLFVGAAAKSAQVPLHTWLPDAMEGPTPVSALIHAATMVTAGVYLIVRCNVLYQLAPHASEMVAIAGAITLFMAATIATVQEDIKRVLAWSTVSQIGYMIMAAGLGLYTGAMFHFLTHAFFKALMFLVAGIVIHALAGEQGIDRMGGLRRYLPVSWVLMGVGCLAIAGVPPFSGFFSKDEILARAWDAGDLGKVLSIVGLAGAVLTAFYMFRMFFRVFHGPEPEGGYDHEPHNPTIIMTLPVVILGVLAVVGGWIQIPTVNHGINTWLDPSLLADPGIEASHATEWRTIAMSLAAAVVGIGVAWMIFGAGGGRRRIEMADRFPALRRFLLDQWRFDPMIDDAVVAPGRDLGDTAVARFEPRGALGIASLGSGLATGAGRLVRASQNGMVRVSAFGVVLGVAIVAVAMILGR
ncbi:MAG: NADH-quinone oxidoreductase subunit L [Thermoleophilia bacterium]|nr:NADH-quinone oxidoreductase subunit L [Thermoleophilia bacterium]